MLKKKTKKIKYNKPKDITKKFLKGLKNENNE